MKIKLNHETEVSGIETIKFVKTTSSVFSPYLYEYRVFGFVVNIFDDVEKRCIGKICLNLGEWKFKPIRLKYLSESFITQIYLKLNELNEDLKDGI